jgi:hypothetical protein
MLSSISGIYFAGHLITPATTPFPPAPPTGASLYYNMAYGSYSGSGNTITDLSGNGWNMTIASNTGGWPISIGYNNTDPKSIGFNNFYTYSATANFPAGMFMLSRTVYKAVTFWFKTTSFNNNGIVSLLSMADPTTSDGIYMSVAYDGKMQLTTNGQSFNNVQNIQNIVLSLNVWQMVTFVYISSDTLPCKLYVNDVEVYSYLHGNDFISTVVTKLLVSMNPGRGAQWNDLQMHNNGYTAADVTTRFAATRGYYGV